MLSLAVVVLGIFAASRLGIDLLPHIVYPEVGVRVTDSGVPAVIMEDQVTRPLEEALAATEDAIALQSQSTEGRSSVDLSFAYGTDVDQALRDASSRLDRAKRLLPTTVEPATIFKCDPSQIPVVELVVASPLRDPVALRTWVDDVFARWFINLPGVPATEVGGGLVREVHILPDQQRLAGVVVTTRLPVFAPGPSCPVSAVTVSVMPSGGIVPLEGLTVIHGCVVEAVNDVEDADLPAEPSITIGIVIRPVVPSGLTLSTFDVPDDSFGVTTTRIVSDGKLLSSLQLLIAKTR